jgi:Polyketide cyclase / dehydrase and lipid transport
MNPMLELPTTASTEAQLTVSPHERSISCSIPIACSPATLYAIWSDVAHWHTWDPDTKWARLDHAFTTGSTGKLAPQKGMAVKMLITEATPNKSFTAECRVLGNRMIFTHTLQVTSEGIIATHRAQFQGWLSGLFMKTVGSDVQKGLPLTMTRLKHLCETSTF